MTGDSVTPNRATVNIGFYFTDLWYYTRAGPDAYAEMPSVE